MFPILSVVRIEYFLEPLLVQSFGQFNARKIFKKKEKAKYTILNIKVAITLVPEGPNKMKYKNFTIGVRGAMY